MGNLPIFRAKELEEIWRRGEWGFDDMGFLRGRDRGGGFGQPCRGLVSGYLSLFGPARACVFCGVCFLGGSRNVCSFIDVVLQEGSA